MVFTGLTKYRDFGLLLLRLGIGGMFIVFFGWPKIHGGPHAWKGVGEAMGNFGIHFLPVMWGFFAALAEFGGGILLALGLLFRPACAAMLFTMIVATTMLFRAHDGSFIDSLAAASQPLGFAILFLSLIFIGPGRFSFDRN